MGDYSNNELIMSILSNRRRASAYLRAHFIDKFEINMHRFGHSVGYWVGNAYAAGLLDDNEDENREAIIGNRRRILAKLNITGIIACMPNPEMPYANDGIEYLVVPITDVDNDENRQILTSMMPQIIRFIGEHNTLIHCDFLGSSRSSTVAIAIEIAHGRDFGRTYMALQGVRPISNPKFGNWLELYEKTQCRTC